MQNRLSLFHLEFIWACILVTDATLGVLSAFRTPFDEATCQFMKSGAITFGNNGKYDFYAAVYTSLANQNSIMAYISLKIVFGCHDADIDEVKL